MVGPWAISFTEETVQINKLILYTHLRQKAAVIIFSRIFSVNMLPRVKNNNPLGTPKTVSLVGS